jgi:hypothetical protein
MANYNSSSKDNISNNRAGLIKKNTFSTRIDKKVLDRFWVVGIVEGDGCFTYSESSGAMFIVRQANPLVLYMLQSYFGFGSVFLRSDGYWSYSVHRKRDLEALINFFNGKIFLQKRVIQFSNWVRAFNRHYGTSYTPRTSPAQLSLNNGWLCGFRDRDGSFGLYLGTCTDNGT